MVRLMILVGCVSCSGSAAPASSSSEPPVTVVTAPADAALTPTPPARQPTHLTRDESFETAEGIVVALDGYVVEQTAPADDTEVPEHGVTIQLQFDGEDVTLYQSAAVDAPAAVAWIYEYRIEIAGHDPQAPSVDVHLDRVGPELVAGTERSVRIARGETIDLGDGNSMLFESHGHKSVVAGGPGSPLLVRLSYRDGRGHTEGGGASLYPPDESSWHWRDYSFVLTDYEYDAFMVIDVARFALTPLQPSGAQSLPSNSPP